MQHTRYGTVDLLAMWVSTLPMAQYQRSFREHACGMSTQSFGAWAGEATIELALFVVIGSLVIGGHYLRPRPHGRGALAH